MKERKPEMKHQTRKGSMAQKNAGPFIGSALTGIAACCIGIFGLAASGNSGTAPAVVALGILLAVNVVLTVIGCVNFKKAVIKPLEEVSEACVKFAEGDLNTVIQYRANDQAGRLVETLNYVFRRLQVIVGEISSVLAKMSDGDFASVKVEDYKKDFAPVSDSFHKILDQMNRTFTLFQSSAEQVDAGARQVSDGAQALAQGSTEQASSSEELSASIQEISQKIGETSGHVSEVTEYLNTTAQNVEDSNMQMRKLLTAMDEINTSSVEIGKIIKVIDDIAFQTNILALNAAVEASRAGEAGKGFAVVADEVRSLAGKSAEAAKQTAELIETAIGKVKGGKELADGTAKTLSGVTEKIQKLDGSIQQIDKVTNAQTVAITQITQGVEQISTVIQTNSATAEESAAASEELSGQAKLLTEELLKYKVRNSGRPVQTKQGKAAS
jgi:methyl-accepting chemotaxis protein